MDTNLQHPHQMAQWPVAQNLTFLTFGSTETHVNTSTCVFIILKNSKIMLSVMGHTLNPSTKKAVTGRSLSICGHPGLHREF